jgi:pyridoxal phosphate enzyme (YggS family)
VGWDDIKMSSIAENLKAVENRIEQAAKRAKRNPSGIKLVAVSKIIPIPLIKEGIEAGIKILGENRVQEAKEKIESLGRIVEWHMVGHLQRNKVKHIFDMFDMVHSLDSLPLAQEINKEGMKRNRTMKVLIQVNVAGEETKSGLPLEELIPTLKQMAPFKHISIRGLMTMPPFFSDPERARAFFRELQRLAGEVEREGIEGVSMEEFSMGMSHDYEIAIEEGATMVRVGTAIFGPRG